MRLLEGRPVAEAIRAEAAREGRELTARGRRPGLGMLLVGDDPASAIYMRNKTRACDEAGIHHETVRLTASATTEDVAREVRRFNGLAEIHGVLVQLPLPRQVDRRQILDLVDPSKDVDGLHPTNVGLLAQNRPRFVPCTPAGILELLLRSGVEVAGKRAVIVGRSDMVGKPMALLLMHANATVTVCHSRTANLAAVTREADILVVAMGRAGLIRGDHVKPGAVVIDVGTNRVEDPELAREILAPERWRSFEEKGHALVGDVHFPSVREVASALTPVPGGVGPLTIAHLVRNTVLAAAQA